MVKNNTTVTFQTQVLSSSIEDESNLLLANSETDITSINNSSAPRVDGNQSLDNLIPEKEKELLALIRSDSDEKSLTLDSGGKNDHSISPSLV
jgi:hypothetical protein